MNVKCPWKNLIVLPEGATLAAGETCFCPGSCPSKNAHAKTYCQYGYFIVKGSSFNVEEYSGGPYSYTAEEVAKRFPELSSPKRAPSASRAEPRMLRSQPAQTAQPQTAQPQAPQPQAPQPQTAQPQAPQPQTAQPQTADSQSSEQRPPKKYVFPVAGSPSAEAPSQTASAQPQSQPAAPAKRPPQNFSYFELRGRYFKVGGKEGSNLSRRSDVNALFDAILSHYDIGMVFEGNAVRPQFLWLLSVTSGMLSYRYQAALNVLNNAALTREEKFFILFYGVIFAGSGKPLYWSAGYSDSVAPQIYRSESSFYERVATEKDEGFYYKNPKAVLLWLGRISAEEWSDEKKVHTASENLLEAVTTNASMDVIAFSSQQTLGKLVYLGRKEEFIKNLPVPSKSESVLESTAEFLSRYDIIRQGGAYRVVPRNPADGEYSVQVQESEVNDVVLQMLFSGDVSFNKLGYYLYVLKRYCEMLKPHTVTVGPLEFSAGMYTEEIEGLVLQACAYLYGDVEDGGEKNEAYGRALLAKLLYEKGILNSFTSAQTRSRGYMQELLSLITPDAVRAERVLNYFTVFHKNGRGEKIKLYVYDYSAKPPKRAMLSLKEHLIKKAESVNSLSALCALLKTQVFKAYAEVFSDGESRREQVRSLFETYSRQEQAILNRINSL